MEEKNYKKDANPTYFTAKGTLYKLAQAKNQDAVEFIKLIDMTDFVKGFRENGSPYSVFPKDVAFRMQFGTGCAVELRYGVVSKLLKESNLKNFFDIACGYTPRSLYCKRNSIDYIGIDVPIVVEELNEKVSHLVKNNNHIPYIACDATNPSSIIKMV